MIARQANWNSRSLNSNEIGLYAEYIDEYRSYRLPVIQEIAQRLSGQRVLEVQSGLGAFAPELMRSRTQLQVVAVEDNQFIMGTARRLMHERGLAGQWSCVSGDADRLPFESESFDAVISTDALRVWADPVASLRECRRVVRQRGHIVIHDLRRDSHVKMVEMVLTALGSKQSSAGKWFVNYFLNSWKSSYTSEELEQLALDAGFSEFDVVPSTAMTHAFFGRKG